MSQTKHSILETEKLYFEVRLDPNRKPFDWMKRYSKLGGGWEGMRDLSADASHDETGSDCENSNGLPGTKEEEGKDPVAGPLKQTERAWLEVKVREGLTLEELLGPFDQLGKGLVLNGVMAR